MSYWNRWPKNKHDQILHLLSYAQMCGLTGKDLVSLGNHLERQRVSDDSAVLMHRVHAMPIHLPESTSQDPWYEQRWWTMPWVVTAVNGRNYRIIDIDYMWFSCRSDTGQQRKLPPQTHCRWPSHWRYRRRHSYDFALDICNGVVVLDW